MEKTMENIIERLVEDFNEYSELVALNYAQRKEKKIDDGLVEWNRGILYRTEEYLNEIVRNTNGVSLKWEFGEHTFGFDGWKRQLEYRTVRVIFEEA